MLITQHFCLSIYLSILTTKHKSPLFFCHYLGPEPSPKPSTSPPSSLGSPGRRPPKSPSEHKERKPSLSDDKKKVVRDLWPSSHVLNFYSKTNVQIFSFSTLRLFVLAAPGRLQRLQLLLGGPLPRSHHSEENRRRVVWNRFQGQVARRRRHQNLKSHWANAGTTASLQKRNAGLTVRATLKE